MGAAESWWKSTPVGMLYNWFSGGSSQSQQSQKPSSQQSQSQSSSSSSSGQSQQANQRTSTSQTSTSQTSYSSRGGTSYSGGGGDSLSSGGSSDSSGVWERSGNVYVWTGSVVPTKAPPGTTVSQNYQGKWIAEGTPQAGKPVTYGGNVSFTVSPGVAKKLEEAYKQGDVVTTKEGKTLVIGVGTDAIEAKQQTQIMFLPTMSTAQYNEMLASQGAIGVRQPFEQEHPILAKALLLSSPGTILYSAYSGKSPFPTLEKGWAGFTAIAKNIIPTSFMGSVPAKSYEEYSSWQKEVVAKEPKFIKYGKLVMPALETGYFSAMGAKKEYEMQTSKYVYAPAVYYFYNAPISRGEKALRYIGWSTAEFANAALIGYGIGQVAKGFTSALSVTTLQVTATESPTWLKVGYYATKYGGYALLGGFGAYSAYSGAKIAKAIGEPVLVGAATGATQFGLRTGGFIYGFTEFKYGPARMEIQGEEGKATAYGWRSMNDRFRTAFTKFEIQTEEGTISKYAFGTGNIEYYKQIGAVLEPSNPAALNVYWKVLTPEQKEFVQYGLKEFSEHRFEVYGAKPKLDFAQTRIGQLPESAQEITYKISTDYDFATFGSLPTKARMEAAGMSYRLIHDVDVMTSDAQELAGAYQEGLMSVGVPARIVGEGQVETYFAETGKWEKIFDIHSIAGEGTHTLKGYPFGEYPLPYGKGTLAYGEGYVVPASHLQQEFVNKMSSATTIRFVGEEITLAPEEHRLKDIGDMLAIGKAIMPPAKFDKFYKLAGKVYGSDVAANALAESLGQGISGSSSTFQISMMAASESLSKSLSSLAGVGPGAKVSQKAGKEIASRSQIMPSKGSFSISKGTSEATSRASQSASQKVSKSISSSISSYKPSSYSLSSYKPSSYSISSYKSLSYSPSSKPSSYKMSSYSISSYKPSSYSPSSYYPSLSAIPPLLPDGGGFGKGGAGKGEGKERGYKYTPSFAAIQFKIKGVIPKKQKFTGFEIRPIPKSKTKKVK